MTRITKARRETVWKLYYEGHAIWEIANAVGLTEAQVVKILDLK